MLIFQGLICSRIHPSRWTPFSIKCRLKMAKAIGWMTPKNHGNMKLCLYHFHIVDRSNPTPVEVASVPHYLQGFIHPTDGCLGFLNHPQHASKLVHFPAASSIATPLRTTWKTRPKQCISKKNLKLGIFRILGMKISMKQLKATTSTTENLGVMFK